MPTTTTTLTPLAKIIPYIGPAPSQDLWNTVIPRAEIIFSEIATVVTAAAAGEDQLLLVTCTLPEGFGYVLRDFSMRMADTEVGDTADWEDNGDLQLQDGPGNSTSTWIHSMGIEKEVVSASATLSAGIYRLWGNTLSKVLIPTGGGLVMLTRNLTIDGGPMFLNYFARFLQFDLNQTYRAILNTPIPVR